MPVETVVGFATEQAVGILVGAAAVAVAPMIAPKLRSVMGGAQDATVDAVDSAKDAGSTLMDKTSAAGAQVVSAGTAAAVAVTQPLAGTGKSAYHGAMAGAHWYLEHWADITAEAHEWVWPATHMTPAEVAATLPTAKVVSDLPGRARIHLEPIRRNGALAKQVAAQVASHLEGGKVTASAATGNVLIHYDRAQFGSLGELLGRFAGV